MNVEIEDHDEAYRRLPRERRDICRELMGAEETLLRLLFDQKARAWPRRGPAFFDFSLFHEYATERVGSPIDRYGRLVIDLLALDDLLMRYVDADIASGASCQDALVEDFVNLVTGELILERYPIADAFWARYRHWVKECERPTLTLGQVQKRHKDNFEPWIPKAFDHGIYRPNSFRTLSESFYEFLSHGCEDSLDREIALLLEQKFLSAIEGDFSVMAALRRSEYARGMTERDMRRAIARVRERLAAHFAVDRLPYKLLRVAAGDAMARYFESRFLSIAGVSAPEAVMAFVAKPSPPSEEENEGCR